jgi:hypothetical protein
VDLLEEEQDGNVRAPKPTHYRPQAADNDKIILPTKNNIYLSYPVDI